MATDQSIINELRGIEAMALTLQHNAAMLRQKLSADAQPVASRKGDKNIEMANAAKSYYNEKKLKQSPLSPNRKPK